MTAVVDLSRELLHICKDDQDLRLKESAFTRERKLGANRMLQMLLHRLAGPLQLELDAYCEFLETAPVSKQAFSKARANLNQNRTIANLRDRFWRILLQNDPILRERMLDRLCADIAVRPESVRPDRSPARKSPRKNVSIWLKNLSCLKLDGSDITILLFSRNMDTPLV